MALRTFTDIAIILTIENCLIQELPNIFTAEVVNQVFYAELTRLASESEDVRDERAQLQKEHDALTEGLESCNRFGGETYFSLEEIRLVPELASQGGTDPE
ncbi:hypothetical protein PG999_004310 [Apiospora kogelbergensis]|uniref:GED domain-containing protein n=1 Tax=Apiospora kogelbergensis TaxID=1337665 RepID=A0AAW0QYX2_9PEZI